MDKVLILDFGSQYTQLIARRVRELKVYCEMWPCHSSLTKIKEFGAKAIILSGGPASVLAKGSPKLDKSILELGIPILGICYGMQLMTKMLGGKVVRSQNREYGHASINIKNRISILKGLKTKASVWMSHGDSIKKLAPGFKLLAATSKKVPAAIYHAKRNIAALQFHPEVHHTPDGLKILKNFLFGMANVKASWSMRNYINYQCEQIQQQVGKDHVILGLSGGVDSSVAAALIHKAIGKQLTCIFINNGLLRFEEAKYVKKMFGQHFKIKLRYVDASKLFLDGLKGVKDPEKKRKIIGRLFIKVFTQEAKKIKNAKYLAQGTLYPDVIESVSFKGPSVVIKSHHNVGGLPKRMGLKLVEPLRELFKDEVRELGCQLKMPKEMIYRHPFPGPGLGVRVIGVVSPDKVKLLQLADHIAMQVIKETGWYDKIWQALVALLPIQSVGVMGDERTYEYTAVFRAVTSVDGMTADWVDIPHEVLSKISNRIINEVRGINRVLYDISSKPPATIELE
ncbi:glutamine-hydrolyzing GMP synthase [bacterium K02(2017)]|nr:glutamine-hydrolyzing GMP synthase [bacterium K02(2017)]